MSKIKQLFRRLFPARAGRINLEYPTCWELMSAADFKEVCIILATPGLGRERSLFLCLCRLTHIQPADVRAFDAKQLKGRTPFIINGKLYLIATSTIAEACNQLSFIYDGAGLPPSPFPEVDRHITGISFEAFFAADSYLMRAAAEKNDCYLKEALKQLTGGRRRKMLDWEKQGLVIWWNGVKAYLKERYPYVFREGDGITSKTQAEILQDLLACMNDNRPQENEKILRTDVHSVLYSLNRLYENAVKKSTH